MRRRSHKRLYPCRTTVAAPGSTKPMYGRDRSPGPSSADIPTRPSLTLHVLTIVSSKRSTLYAPRLGMPLALSADLQVCSVPPPATPRFGSMHSVHRPHTNG